MAKRWLWLILKALDLLSCASHFDRGQIVRVRTAKNFIDRSTTLPQKYSDSILIVERASLEQADCNVSMFTLVQNFHIGVPVISQMLVPN